MKPYLVNGKPSYIQIRQTQCTIEKRKRKKSTTKQGKPKTALWKRIGNDGHKQITKTKAVVGCLERKARTERLIVR